MTKLLFSHPLVARLRLARLWRSSEHHNKFAKLKSCEYICNVKGAPLADTLLMKVY